MATGHGKRALPCSTTRDIGQPTNERRAGVELKKTPRIALGVLIGWTVATVVLGVVGALVAPHGNRTELSTWTEQDYRLLAAALGGFLTWFVGLATIALITIVVRLGHLTQEATA